MENATRAMTRFRAWMGWDLTDEKYRHEAPYTPAPGEVPPMNYDPERGVVVWYVKYREDWRP